MSCARQCCDAPVARHGTFCSQVCKRIDRAIKAKAADVADGPSWLDDVRVGRASW